MKGYELLKAISDGEIKNGAKIEIKGKFTGDLLGSYFIYNEGHFRFPTYEPNGTKYSDNVEIYDLINFSFEVIEENKEIKELYEHKTINYTQTDIRTNREKINELVRAVNKINKESEEK